MKRNTAFTLVELLVVVAIIVALLAMLLPSLSDAVRVAQDAVCRTQQRQIAQGMLTFAAEHTRSLPGIWTEGPESWQKCWAAAEVGASVASGASYNGVLVNYLGGVDTVRKLYRDPALQPAPLGSGLGSNGRFDYAAIHHFSGAKISLLPVSATWLDPGTGRTNNAGLPLIVEEDPAHHLNTCCIDTGHGNTDQLGAWHKSAGNYAAIDGSVSQLKFTLRGPTLWEWTVRAPSGTLINPVGGVPFGGFNSQ